MKIPVATPELSGNERKYVLEALDSGWISSNGAYIERFEQSFADYLGVRHAMTCCNGTAAVHLALMAVGVGPGDEVIVPTFTFVATANAVIYTGAVPVFVDCDPETWNLDPARIESLITPRTKVIVTVPLYGHPCDMDPIREIAIRYGLRVVEDAAEALGAAYKGKRCGTLGDIATFSLYGNKTITTGEGGIVVTDDDDLAARVRLLKGQGMDPNQRYWFLVLGFNYRMTNIQAAIGLAQLERIDEFLAKRRQVAAWYKEALTGIEWIALPIVRDYAEHGWWMFSVLIDDDGSMKRDDVIAALSVEGVDTRPFFYPIHTLPMYANCQTECPVAEHIAARGINLPTFVGLTEENVNYIARALATYGSKRR
jgi:perosamine synthetase